MIGSHKIPVTVLSIVEPIAFSGLSVLGIPEIEKVNQDELRVEMSLRYELSKSAQ